MAGTRGKPMFKLFEPMSPPPGWKCPKRFKLGLGEPWESEGSDNSDIEKLRCTGKKPQRYTRMLQ